MATHLESNYFTICKARPILKLLTWLLPELDCTWTNYYNYLLLADSIRETRRYNKVDTTPQVDLHNNPQAELMVQMKLFRAQRNLYISGFSLFLLM